MEKPQAGIAGPAELLTAHVLPHDVWAGNEYHSDGWQFTKLCPVSN